MQKLAGNFPRARGTQGFDAIVMQPARQADQRLAVTRLSRAPAAARGIRVVLRLARRSLGLLSIMLVAESCIVAEPPEYRAPGQTRPVLNVYSAVPTATRALVVYTEPDNRGETEFTIQVRSEDAGESLRALFFLDYQMRKGGPEQPGEQRLNSQTIPASTYDYLGRVVRFTWTPLTTDGCHFMSLIVAHESSFLDSNNDRLDPRKADDDAAIVTWTVSVNPKVDGTLENCPSNDKIPG